MAPHYHRLALASALLLTLSACQDEVKPVEEIRPVRYTTASSSDAAASQQFSGEVRARQESPLSFRVGGNLIKRHVDAGQRHAEDGDARQQHARHHHAAAAPFVGQGAPNQLGSAKGQEQGG